MKRLFGQGRANGVHLHRKPLKTADTHTHTKSFLSWLCSFLFTLRFGPLMPFAFFYLQVSQDAWPLNQGSHVKKKQPKNHEMNPFHSNNHLPDPQDATIGCLRSIESLSKSCCSSSLVLNICFSTSIISGNGRFTDPGMWPGLISGN